MRKYRLLFALLAAVSLLGCAKTSMDPEAEPCETTVPAVPSAFEETVLPTSVETTAPVQETQPPASDSNFVRITDYIPTAVIELKYASADNFTGQTIYEFQDAYLRYGTVKKLMKVSESLSEQGLCLKIWDAFRPTAAQFKLWEVYPDGNFVSNPNIGFSSHSRGGTVDITLVDALGNELEMPCEFDDFSSLADRNYSDCSETAAQNALLLQETMEQYGFKGYQNEWWHFSDTDEYPVEEAFDPAFFAPWYADCTEFISLRTEPNTSAPVIIRIPAEEEITLFGWNGDFALVDYQGMQGYVLGQYISPVNRENSLPPGTPEAVGRPATKEIEFYPGSEPETLHLNLHVGHGYSIYIPSEDWTLEQIAHSGNAPMFEDIWTSTVVDDAELKVAYYADQALEEVRSLIEVQEKEFELTQSKRGGLIGRSMDGSKNLDVNLYQIASGVMSVSFHYRMEDAEQYGTQLSVLADTFGVTEYFWESSALE